MEQTELFDHLLAEFRGGAYGFTLRSNTSLAVHRSHGIDRDAAIRPDAAALEILARKLLPSRELRMLRSGEPVHMIRKMDDDLRVLIGARVTEKEFRMELRRTTF